MNNEALSRLRTEYQMAAFDERDALTNPFDQFRKWLGEAVAAELPEPNAMTLATVSETGKPSARVVLLKGVDNGLIFYTNYHSRKGHEMEHNQEVALVFLWLELQRQVRVEGRVEKITRAESEAYFKSRPKGSQIGAWASRQSSILPDRETLEEIYEAYEYRYEDVPTLPLAPNWGGYRVVPNCFEFWQGRSSRLHDRLRYRLQTRSGRWNLDRLAP